MATLWDTEIGMSRFTTLCCWVILVFGEEAVEAGQFHDAERDQVVEDLPTPDRPPSGPLSHLEIQGVTWSLWVDGDATPVWNPDEAGAGRQLLGRDVTSWALRRGDELYSDGCTVAKLLHIDGQCCDSEEVKWLVNEGWDDVSYYSPGTMTNTPSGPMMSFGSMKTISVPDIRRKKAFVALRPDQCLEEDRVRQAVEDYNRKIDGWNTAMASQKEEEEDRAVRSSLSFLDDERSVSETRTIEFEVPTPSETKAPPP